MAENLQPGTITTLGALRPGDVGEFEGIYTTLFVMTESGRCEWADGSWQWFNPDIPVIYRGRGKIAPAVPPRIVMDGEPDRVAELEAQVRTLQKLVKPKSDIPCCVKCGRWMSEHWDFPDRCEGFVMPETIELTIAATAPKEKRR